ncbi:hypothetical protein [Cellulophaga sp. BC115SP]|uniref:hypothetical protein n=1 Tax=Cellulophaga sp. BC115SP TaxID=2683263 RepID=UPI0014123EBA|nr:hypothetical protein [Cellulophaga sp. BC115SP]NBB29546.1 hypothetical protein [Cellulophaga sp. BC115SP]
MKSNNIIIGALVVIGAGTLAGIILANSKDGIGKNLQYKGKEYLVKLKRMYENLRKKSAKYDSPPYVETVVLRNNPK